MQWLPTGPTSCLIREISYVLPDERREMKAARYLNWRINRQVNAEDTELIARVQQGMASRSRSEEHTSELQSLMRISYAVFCLKTNNTNYTQNRRHNPIS